MLQHWMVVHSPGALAYSKPAGERQLSAELVASLVATKEEMGQRTETELVVDEGMPTTVPKAESTAASSIGASSSAIPIVASKATQPEMPKRAMWSAKSDFAGDVFLLEPDPWENKALGGPPPISEGQPSAGSGGPVKVMELKT